MWRCPGVYGNVEKLKRPAPQPYTAMWLNGQVPAADRAACRETLQFVDTMLEKLWPLITQRLEGRTSTPKKVLYTVQNFVCLW